MRVCFVDSRQRFVMLYAIVSLVPFTLLAFLNSTDITLYIIAFILSYLFLRVIVNPRFRLSVDLLTYGFLVIFFVIIALRALSLLNI